jgi:nucleotide-binding universal stress UspA family protein
MKVLLATEGSDFSDAAIEKCCRMFAESENTEIEILSAAEESTAPAMEPFAFSEDYIRRMNDASREQAGKIVAQAETAIRTNYPGLTSGLTTKVTSGVPERVIVEEAENWGADLIVMGSHGYGFWQRALLGSVSNSVMQHAPCSVLIARKPANSNAN